MSLIELLFSPFGRVNRKTFWLVCPLCCLPGVSLTYLDGLDNEALYGNSLVICLILFGLFLIWPFYAIQIKRWHDRNKSFWWCLLNGLPIIGPLWMIIELGFFKGTPGPNQYGVPQKPKRISQETPNTKGSSIKMLLIVFIISFSLLMYLYKEHLIFRISAYIAGIVLVLLWLKYLSVGKIFTRIHSSVPCLNVWQFNILPILTAVCLFLTGNIVFLPLMALLWFLPNFLSFIFHDSSFQLHVPYFMSIVYGLYIGVSFGGLFHLTSTLWTISSGIFGILVIQVTCSLILNYVTGLGDRT